LRDYAEAWEVHQGPEARRPAFRLAASLAGDYLQAQAVVKAIETLDQVSAMRQEAKDLGPGEMGALAKLQSSEDEVVKLTGEKLRDHQKAMLSDKEAWERSVQEKMASRPGSTNLEIKP